MKQINLIWGFLMLAFFVFMAYTARTTLRYWTVGAIVGPGPGYFPFWVCTILAGLTVYWIGEVIVQPGGEIPKDFVPSSEGGLLVILVFIDMILFTAIVNYVGFPVAMFLFCMIMIVALDKGRNIRTIALYVLFAVAVTAFFTILFGRWLEVWFPQAELDIFKPISALSIYQ